MGRFAFVGLILASMAVVWLVVSSGREEKTIRVEGENMQGRDLQLVTLLPFDAIGSIDSPVMLEKEEADSTYNPGELVLGVEINGDTRAYSVPLLSGHEIVNDIVGGEPMAITW